MTGGSISFPEPLEIPEPPRLTTTQSIRRTR